MKRFVIALVILAATITAGVLETVYIERTFDELDARINALERPTSAHSPSPSPKRKARWNAATTKTPSANVSPSSPCPATSENCLISPQRTLFSVGELFPHSPLRGI